MTTIENLKELKAELESLAKFYSGTLASITLSEDVSSIKKVLEVLETKEEQYKCLYYKRILKDNINLLSLEEVKKLNNNWLTSKNMIELCDKYNIDYYIIDFHK